MYKCDNNVKKEILEQDKETMNIEYEFVCNFIKLRHKLRLTQQQMIDKSGVIREPISILKARKKHHK